MTNNNDRQSMYRVCLGRRRFVEGLALGGVFASMGLGPNSLLAATMKPQVPQILYGTDFNLMISEQVVNYTGVPRIATTVNGLLPAPVLRWRQGDTVTVRITNLLPETSSIHWHGIILPSDMDGVPGIANDFYGIKPGDTFTYQFPLVQSGTYWYHSHSGFQEQTGLYGPIIIDPIRPDPIGHDRDYVVMLSDWTDEDPMRIYSKLKKLSHYYNFNERTHADLVKDIRQKGLVETFNDRKMWNQMRMSQRDLSDVTGYTYTFLTNGQTPNDNWTGLFNKGDKVKLRFINGSAMTFFDVRIPGLSMTVVAADGQDVEPVTVDEFRLGVAETYDVIVQPNDDRAYTIFAQDIARSGYARGTLAPHPSMTASIPAMDSVSNLTHADMGMNMLDHTAHEQPARDHSRQEMPRAQTTTTGSVHDQHVTPGDRPAPGMDQGHYLMPASQAMRNHSQMSRELGTSEQINPAVMHGEHQMIDGGEMKMSLGKSNLSDFTADPIHHAATEYGPQVDMRADVPRYRLDDPGIGLRNNGRRVLTYADLRSLRNTSDQLDPDREIELHLTGNMGRYLWSINGVKHADSEPLRWKLGERLRITFVNDTMMNHPMHLHGMWSDLETGDNNHLPRKHTVVVQPGSRISYRVTVDAEGGWAYHCHLLYHMPGMFRTVIVSRGTAA